MTLGLWPLYWLLVGSLAVAAVYGAQSGAAGVSVPKRGFVTITMAIVGKPGNPSVGVIQTFGGPKGQFVEPPENSGGTGI